MDESVIYLQKRTVIKLTTLISNITLRINIQNVSVYFIYIKEEDDICQILYSLQTLQNSFRNGPRLQFVLNILKLITVQMKKTVKNFAINST